MRHRDPGSGNDATPSISFDINWIDLGFEENEIAHGAAMIGFECNPATECKGNRDAVKFYLEIAPWEAVPTSPVIGLHLAGVLR